VDLVGDDIPGVVGSVGLADIPEGVHHLASVDIPVVADRLEFVDILEVAGLVAFVAGALDLVAFADSQGLVESAVAWEVVDLVVEGAGILGVIGCFLGAVENVVAGRL